MSIVSSTYEQWLRRHVDADPRLLEVQVRRAAEAISSAMYDAPLWAAMSAILCSETIGVFGRVPLQDCFLFVAVIALSSVMRYVAVSRYRNWERQPHSLEGTFRWSRYFLIVQLTLSSAWGLNAWLLWDTNSLVNHVFLSMVSLAVVTRFLVTRAGQHELLAVSLIPLLIIVFARYVMDLTLNGFILGGMMAAYTVQLLSESRRVSERSASDAHLRFVNEDMARDLEEARDEALKKRFEAETANASKTAFLPKRGYS